MKQLDRPGGASPSARRAVLHGLGGGAIVALVFVVFAAGLAFSAGLVVVAWFMGRIVGSLIRNGAGTTLSPSARESVAIVISVGFLALANVATWLVARAEGGVLPIGDYLYQAYGPLVPLEALVATFTAWWSAR